jgi:hypothetical protein
MFMVAVLIGLSDQNTFPAAIEAVQSAREYSAEDWESPGLGGQSWPTCRHKRAWSSSVAGSSACPRSITWQGGLDRLRAAGKERTDGGSTWHAAGNVPTFSTSWSIMNMQRYSTELYRGLGEAVDYPMNYHVTGSIRLGHSDERMQEFERARGMGRHQGMNLEILAGRDQGQVSLHRDP